ncbi:MAG: type II secretion system protein [Sedimentisphaerales bacterium]|nr:type II secretion system protein [Sedimentisphaerales bacterium]
MKRSGHKGFTLIELLVVVSIIALLVSILLPALSKAREQAKKIYCANNLKQIATAMNMYALENKSQYPPFGKYNSVTKQWDDIWPWACSYYMTDLVLASGGDRRTMYCPSNLDRDKDVFWWMDQAWGGAPMPITPDREIQGENRKSFNRVIGYVTMLEPFTPRGRQVLGGPPAKQWVRRNNVRYPSEVEFFVDIVLSNNGDPDNPATSFSQIAGNSFDIWKIYDRTNHLLRKQDPTGGNVVFIDNHVDWRQFEQMEVRLINPPPGANLDWYYFWW